MLYNGYEKRWKHLLGEAAMMNMLEKIEAEAFAWRDDHMGALLEMFSELHDQYIQEREIEAPTVSNRAVMESVIERLSMEGASKVICRGDVVFPILASYFSVGFKYVTLPFEFEAIAESSLLYGDEYFAMSKKTALQIVVHVFKDSYNSLAGMMQLTGEDKVH